MSQNLIDSYLLQHPLNSLGVSISSLDLTEVWAVYHCQVRIRYLCRHVPSLPACATITYLQSTSTESRLMCTELDRRGYWGSRDRSNFIVGTLLKCRADVRSLSLHTQTDRIALKFSTLESGNHGSHYWIRTELFDRNGAIEYFSLDDEQVLCSLDRWEHRA